MASEARANAAWQMVTCVGCDRTYRCTPGEDYYNTTTLDDGVCERCLLNESKPRGAAPPDPGYIGPRLQALLDAGLVALHPDFPAASSDTEGVEHGAG